MSWAVSTMNCFDTVADNSFSSIVFIFTIVAHVLTAENSNIPSNTRTESIYDSMVTTSAWVTEPLTKSQRTNIPTSIPKNSSVLLPDLRPLTSSYSADTTVNIYISNGHNTADISAEKVSGEQLGIPSKAHTRTSTAAHAERGSNTRSSTAAHAERRSNTRTSTAAHAERGSNTRTSTAAHAERGSMSVYDGAVSSASEYLNRNSLGLTSDFRSVLYHVISDVATNNNNINNNNNMKSFLIDYLSKQFGSTPSGYDPAYSALSHKHTTSDNSVSSAGSHVLPAFERKSLDASWKTTIVTSVQVAISAFQRSFIALSQILRRMFPVDSKVKPEPHPKVVPVKLTNMLRKKIKRSNFHEDLSELSQSSKTPTNKLSDRINTPPNVPELPASTVNPLQNSDLLQREQNRTPFSTDKPAGHDQANSGGSLGTLDLPSSSPFINSSLEKNLLSWFGGASVVFGVTHSNTSGGNVTSSVHDNRTTLALVASDGQMPCNDDCSGRQGVCVMGNDFKMHCVVVDDACEQFPCVNGGCVATDGLYKCECHGGWVGTFCDTQCTLDCGDNGYCGSFDDNDTVACICHWNYTGYRCQDKRKILNGIIEVPVNNQDLQVWHIAVVVTMVTSCLALICVLLPYLLWRRRWIPIRKLIFYFQDYEDDDEKEFDAFISYKSTPKDEKFILQHLYPKLEKELHFKLCLHFRDFPPGEPIANNIIRAIEGSRRTILILSPSFVSSEWCRMEYQKAQYEMLKLKHKIIPIILEDISGMPEIDRNLQNIMNTVTYITWPGDEGSVSSKRISKFWTLLELSMPKRKSEYQRSSSCGSMSLTNVDSVVSSISEDDSPANSSRDDVSVSENSISSTDNSEISKESPGSSLDFPFCPNFQDGVKKARHVNSVSEKFGKETNINVSVFNEAIDGIVKKACHVNSGSEKFGKETNINVSVFNETIDGIVKHRKTSSGEYDNCGFLDSVSGGLQSIPKGDNEYQGKEQKSVFLSSDDYIVEIRETGMFMNGVQIKHRPRQMFV